MRAGKSPQVGMLLKREGAVVLSLLRMMKLTGKWMPFDMLIDAVSGCCDLLLDLLDAMAREGVEAT